MSLSENFEKIRLKIRNHLKTSVQNAADLIVYPFSALERARRKQNPEWIKQNDWNNNSGKQVDNQTTTDINNFVEVTNNSQVNNNIYVSPVIIYQQDDQNDTRPAKNLPQPEEVLNQTPTTVSIGAPITLEQSIENHQFGRLLHNPFGGKQKIRQIDGSNYQSRLEKVWEQGLEEFAKYLAKDKDIDYLAAVVLITPEYLRGNGGGTGLIFGADYLKNLAAFNAASANNAFVGISDTVPLSYEIEKYNPEILEATNKFDLVKSITTNNFSEKIFKILGGNNWQFDAENFNLPSMQIHPEATINFKGTNLFSENNNNPVDTVVVNNFFDLITNLLAVNYFRSGHHRLPATVLTSLINTDEGNQPLTIDDSLSFSEWIVRQLDAVVGEFPLNIKYQGQNEQGQSTEQTIPIQNLSEGIAEILGLNLGAAADGDTLIQIAMKTLVEARAAANAAIVATDYAAANAEYLGYKGNQIERKIPLTFTPGAANLTDALKPSEKSIISWTNEDKETLVELIKKTLVGAEIIKASLFHPWQPGQPITGDKIKEDREAIQQQNEEKWEQFKQRVNNPTGQYNLNKPKAHIKDLTVDTPNNEL